MLITDNNIHKIGSNRILEIPFNNVNNEEIIKQVELCQKYFDPRRQDDKTFFVPGPPIDVSQEEGVELKECDEKGCTYIKRTKTGTTIPIEIFQNPVITSLYQSVHDYLVKIHKNIVQEEVICSYQTGWVFVSRSDQEEAQYHCHEVFKVENSDVLTNYTWTYYPQLPDNCTGDEGKLAFADNEQGLNESCLEVKPNTLYVFPGKAFHRPNLSPNSSKDRITLAGNLSIPHSKKCFLL